MMRGGWLGNANVALISKDSEPVALSMASVLNLTADADILSPTTDTLDAADEDAADTADAADMAAPNGTVDTAGNTADTLDSDAESMTSSCNDTACTSDASGIAEPADGDTKGMTSFYENAVEPPGTAGAADTLPHQTDHLFAPRTLLHPFVDAVDMTPPGGTAEKTLLPEDKAHVDVAIYPC
ncbi:hypothetical protein MMC07_001762 [Pseudocyphellaria aurata]|nr:hypothetical protein [Pseudocyphellaria aurata]